MKTDINIKTELGRRIRERRKKLGMTQSQLCGEYMTRNMLSRIETGDAGPSLDTLIFIAQKLKTPPAYFLCRDLKEEAEYTKTVRIKDARRLLGTGQYKKCIDICSDLPSDDDEVSFIAANAHLMAAIADFDKGDLKSCAAHLDSGQTALHQTVYMYSEMHSQIKLLRLLMNSLISGAVPEPALLPKMAPMFFSKDRFLYLTALCSFELSGNSVGACDIPIGDSFYKDHLTAKILLSNGEADKAMPLLQRVLDGSNESFTRYFVLCDMEKAAKALDDYKGAYVYAKEIAALHDKYTL